jgi:hypothetical protein
VQKEDSNFVHGQERPALASKLPESNNATTTIASKYKNQSVTCYHYGEDGHIKPKCPKLRDTQPASNVTPNTHKTEAERTDDDQRAITPLLALQRIHPFDHTVSRIDDDGMVWKLCTKYYAKTSGKQGILNLSQWDSDHHDNSKPSAPVAHLTMISNQLDNVPVGPPLVTTLEPNTELDPNELTFTGAWCCPSDNLPHRVADVARIPKVETQDDASVSSHGSIPPMPVLGPRRSDDSSSDEDSSEDGSRYAQYNITSGNMAWITTMRRMYIDEVEDDDVHITVCTLLIQFIHMLLVTAKLVVLT